MACQPRAAVLAPHPPTAAAATAAGPPTAAASQAAAIFMLNTSNIASFESTAWVNLLFFLPAVVLVALPHCTNALPGELAAYARAARPLRLWLYALSPMPIVALESPTEYPTPMEGLQACAVWNVWLPTLVGCVLPVLLLAATQRAWRRSFLDQRNARLQPAAPPPDVEGWSPAHVCGILIALSCVLWNLVEAVVTSFLGTEPPIAVPGAAL